MKKILSLALASAMMLAVFAGCTSKKTDEGSGSEEGGSGYTIGYAINNLNDTFQTYVHGAAKAGIEASGNTMVTSDAQEDVIKQQDNVNAFIQQGVNGLIVVPVDTSAMDPITEAAQAAGIPLVYVNRNPYAGNEEAMPEGVYYVGSQEFDAGMFQAEYAGELLGGKGGVAILQGILGNEGALQRTEGVKQTLADLYPDMEVLAAETGNWQRDQGLSVTENWITKYGDKLNAVLANNDEMALGAISALKAAGRTDVVVMGVDAIDDAKQSVKDGEMTATVLQDADGQGGGAAKAVIAHLDGSPVDSITWVPFVLLNKDNVDQY